MATKAKVASKVVDDDKEVDAEELLRESKYGKDEVESSKESDETPEAEEPEEESAETSDDEGQTDEVATEESEEESQETSDEETSFVKEFSGIAGDTEEEYRKNLELAYRNSTGEALRLKAELDKTQTKSDQTEEAEEIDLSDPLRLWAKQNLDEALKSAYADFSAHYAQVTDPVEYQRFTRTVAQLSRTIMDSEQRLAPPKELYAKAAVILDWQPNDKVDDKDKLDNALKDRASSSKTVSATKPKAGQSKVTDAEIAIAKQTWAAGKTDTEIRTELEPYVK